MSYTCTVIFNKIQFNKGNNTNVQLFINNVLNIKVTLCLLIYQSIE